MAKQITELNFADPLTPASDLLWLEQAGVPKKLSLNGLTSGRVPLSDTASITTAGWYRIATNSYPAGRGGATFYIINAGGGDAPVPMMFRISKSYTTDLSSASIDVMTSGSHYNEAVEQIRIIFDQTGNNEIHVEVYIGSGSVSDWTHTIVPDGTVGTWASVDYTAGALADHNLTFDLATDDVSRGFYLGDGTKQYWAWDGAHAVRSRNIANAAAGLQIDARGDAYILLNADRVSDAETNNAYIQFSQDELAVVSYIGGVGGTNLAPNGGVMTGMPNNGFAIVHQFATGSIGLGVNQRCAVLINDSDQLIVQFPTTGDQMVLSHNDTNGLITTSAGGLVLTPQSGVVSITGAGGYVQNVVDTTSKFLAGDGSTTTHINYAGLYGTRSGFYVQTNHASGIIYVEANTDIYLRKVGGTVALRANTNNGRVYMGGDTTGYFRSVTGGFGSVQVHGAQAGGFEGFNIAGRMAFMAHPTTERGGIYDDVNNRWVLQWNSANASSNEKLDLHAGAVIALTTQVPGATSFTSAATIQDSVTVHRDIGFNVLPTFNFNASDTLDSRHCGHSTGKTNTTTTYKLTGPTSSNVQFPVGGVCTVMNLGASGNYTLEDTSTCTMYYCDGAAAPVDIALNGTLAPGGIISLYRYSTAAIYIFGSGFTP